jgi:hypothetical protein
LHQPATNAATSLLEPEIMTINRRNTAICAHACIGIRKRIQRLYLLGSMRLLLTNKGFPFHYHANRVNANSRLLQRALPALITRNHHSHGDIQAQKKGRAQSAQDQSSCWGSWRVVLAQRVTLRTLKDTAPDTCASACSRTAIAAYSLPARRPSNVAQHAAHGCT